MFDESTNQGTLDYIEGQATFFERNLNNANRSKLTTTNILASVMILLIKSLIAVAREMKRANDREANK